MARIDPQEGRQALLDWVRDPDSLGRAELALAVRYTLQEFAQDLPGRSVEIRVPPAGATQVLGGTTHRRGTPPAVVEMSPQTWLGLWTGTASWREAEAAGLIDASGERADLTGHFPRL